MAKKQHTHFGYKLLAFVIIIITLAQVFTARGFEDPYFDPPPPPPNDTPNLRFPIPPDEVAPTPEGEKPGIDLDDPSNIKKTVEYDPEENRFYINEQVGDHDIKNPTYLEGDEYLKIKGKEDETDYWRQRLDALSMFNQKPKLPELYKEGIFNRLFGSDKISVKPQGNLDLTFGGNWQNMKNPNLTQRAQKYGIFDFDMQMNVNLLAQIGDKLKLNISNNTLPSFGEQNMQKLEYTGKEDEIIKKIEAGNVSFPLKSSLLTGPLSLFGLKTQLQFGKLFVTGVLSQQKSQRKSINLQGGAQTQSFEIKADDYEENRNFLLGQYFYNNYDKALLEFPVVKSQVVLTQVEVWVTNRTGATQNVRNMINFMDLGEGTPYVTSLRNAAANGLPDNRANRLYELLLQNPNLRTQGSGTTNALVGIGLDPIQGKDYTIATMRQLNASEFSFQPQLGYISLNTQVNADDIVGVAYRYTYNGNIYQVGEFASDLPPDSANTKVMFLKMLKGISATPRLPIWNLMMKNVYSIGGGNVSKEDFRLNVMYQDPGGGEKRYLPEGPNVGVPLITLMNLDRLNAQNDPAPDGVFDYVEGITVNSQMGKIIFPQLEPFGDGLKPSLGGEPRLEKRYLYQLLYDSTKTIARQFQQNNRFLIRGNYKGASGSEVSLGGYNIPQGSVTVTAGGQRLSENVDYQIDYSRGSVKILNQGILASGIPISISYEDNATFGLVQQNFWGARFDYFSSENLTIGGTIMRLTERPFTQKVTYGDDPIKNTVAGLDANYQDEFPWLTKALDKLPIYSTSAPSLISLSGEVAGIFPGHQRFINSLDPEGAVQIDDFEGANSSIDLRFPVNSWTLASTPVGAKDANNRTLFPEASSTADRTSNNNRAKMAWYMIEPTLVDGSFGTPDNIKADTGMQDYWRLVQQKEVYPLRNCVSGQCGLQTFDLGFYPSTRGPYNFEARAAQINTNGTLLNPRERWGGIQRAMDNNSSDFEAANVEYITFWLLDPFIYKPTNPGGDLYINLGNVSEDVLKDSRLSFENGIPSPKDLTKLDITQWGYVPRFQQQITRSFDNDPAARALQDVGYDELDNSEEVSRFSEFLTNMAAIPGITTDALQKVQADPASDDFHHFRGNDYDQLTRHGEAYLRYIDFNSPHGNSPVTELNTEFTNSGSAIPESEDINRDNSLNEAESYFQYRVKLEPSTSGQMQVGNNFIVDKKESDVKLENGRIQKETWYQFKIPIREYQQSVGGISDFRSIRFIRMFMHGFDDTTIVRFAQLQLDRNQWRRYQFSLTAPGENIPEEDLRTTSFALTSVSLEQNSDRSPVPYVLPPGVDRQLTPAQTGQNIQQDEQSLALQLCGLKDGDARAVFKEQRMDMRQYKTIRMFIHAESVPNQAILQDGDLKAFIRIGSDFINNYYEYQIPLTVTPSAPGKNAEAIWPAANKMELLMSKLTDIKAQRNAQGVASYLPFSTIDEFGNTLMVVGNPNFGDVKNIMLGVVNPKKTLQTPGDDGQRKCAEVWFDELRMVDPDEKPGYAASGQANIQLADLGNVHLGGSMHTVGYGNIDQKVDQRFRDNFYAYDANTNLNLGKLLPRAFGLQLPVFVGYTQTISNPKYDPYDKDIQLTDKLESALNAEQRDSMRKAAQDFTSVTSFNLANVRYLGNPENQGKNPMPWSLKNFDANYSYNRGFKRNPLLLKDELVEQRLGLGYNYTVKTKFIEPFKRMIKSKSKWLLPIKDFNFNVLPSSFTFRTSLHRIVAETQVRNIDGGPYTIPSTFFKNFTWDRNYALRWELTRSLSFNYSADNQSRVDEPYGRIDSKEKKDSLWNNFSRLGRNTYFSQTLNVTYTLPTQKFPFLDWTRATATYASTYNWTAASRLAYEQGNIIANTQLKQINGEFTFSQLYNKSRWLKAINTSKIQDKSSMLKSGLSKSGNNAQTVNSSLGSADGKGSGAGGGDGETKEQREQRRKELAEQKRKQSELPPRPEKKEIDKSKIPGADTMTAAELRTAYKAAKKAERKRFKKELAAWRAKRRNIVPEIPQGVRVAGRLVTMLKRVTVNYSENAGTVLPGFMDSTQFLGVNSRSSSWYDFAFGNQPDRAWFDQQAALQRISRDSFFNGQLQQTYAQNYNLQATLEPAPDLRIDLIWNKQFSKNYSETFKYNGDSASYQHYSPYSMGTFSISYIGLKTMFTPSRANELSKPYQDFVNNGAIISRRLGAINPYTAGLPDPDDPDFTKGYTRYSQDVLIPAFLAAYTGRDANTIPLVESNNSNIRSNPFKNYFPMPNWKLTYNGLTKLPKFNEYFTNFTVNHSYTGTLSMNSFLSSFYYNDFLGVGFPSFIDSNSHNYVPFFQVPNITITENLGPLMGVDVALKNGVNLSIKFNKTRMLSLSLVDYQVSETKSTELVLGGGARIKGLVLPFSVFGTRRLKNDLNFNMSVGYRDDMTSNNYLAQNTNIPTRGQKVITISPTVDYIVNDNLQLRFYYDRRQSIPVLSTSYPITTTRAGVTLRFLFAPQ